jgi:2-polyprenyl-3-methyl-5-hydroxy-6-metoxy-1,4-benzoquinol methylase
VIDIVRHVLRDLAARPTGAQAWETLWASTPATQLPWHAASLEPALSEALAARAAPGRRLLDIGTGDGAVAVAAAQLGYRVTALDGAPSALGSARERADAAGARAIAFVLDDITAPRLASALGGGYDLAVDRGVLHGLPRTQWSAYAAGVTGLVSPGGALVIVAHEPPAAGTHAVDPDELRALLPAFSLVRTVPTTLAGAAARLFDLVRGPLDLAKGS